MEARRSAASAACLGSAAVPTRHILAALEGTGVVTNDRQLWTWDGTDQVLAKLRPWVELHISPIGPMP